MIPPVSVAYHSSTLAAEPQTITLVGHRARLGRFLLISTLLGAALVPFAMPAARASTTKPSTPFRVGAVPAGFELVAAGTGTQGQEWGVDESGTDEPFTVLAPDGDPESDRRVVVSVTGFRGYQGGLGQASQGYFDNSEQFRLRGDRAIYAPGGERFGRVYWADLVVAVEPDLAIRVTSPEATRDELATIAERVRPAGRSKAPRVPDPPNGLEVVGSVDADVVAARYPAISDQDAVIPGLETAHSIGWTGPGDRRLTVMTVPGKRSTLDAAHSLPALPVGRIYTTRDVESGDRPGVLLEPSPPQAPGYERRTLITQAKFGGLVIVSASGETAPSAEELATIAESVSPVSDEEWADFVAASATSVLTPDPGAVELARGTAGDVEWLFQARPRRDVNPPGMMIDGDPDAIVADPCLKLSNRRRLCPGSGISGGTDFILDTGSSRPEDTYGVPEFVVVSTSTPGAAIRIETKVETATGPLYPLPSGLWAGIVFVAEPGIAGCAPINPNLTINVMRVDVLDTRGEVVRCLGLPSPS